MAAISVSPNRCMYPGCTVVFGGPKRKYCAKHSQLLLETATKKPAQPPMPTPAPKPPPTTPAPPTPEQSEGNVSSGRVRRNHREQVEVLKRKIAKRAKPP